MLLVRKVRMLWLLVVIVVTPVIALPWNILGKSIAQQQEDDVPVDARLAGVEHVIGSGDSGCRDYGGAAEGHLDLVDLLCRNQEIGDDEDGQGEQSHVKPFAWRSSVQGDFK